MPHDKKKDPHDFSRWMDARNRNVIRLPLPTKERIAARVRRLFGPSLHHMDQSVAAWCAAEASDPFARMRSISHYRNGICEEAEAYSADVVETVGVVRDPSGVPVISVVTGKALEKTYKRYINRHRP